MTLKVIASSLNLRAGPSASAQILKTLPVGTLLTPVEQGPWVYVQTPLGLEGWAHRNYLQPLAQDAASSAKGNFYTNELSKHPDFHSTQPISSMEMLESITRAAIQAVIRDAEKEYGVKLMVFETYRSKERQELLFKQGVTKLRKVGVHHYGLAADLVRIVNGEPSWKGDFSFLVPLGARYGLLSGADWGNPHVKHSLYDPYHLQRVRLADQERLFAGEWYPDATYRGVP